MKIIFMPFLCITAVSFQEQADSNYCQWDPSELNGGYSLGEGGHTFSECEQSCIERGYDCQMFTYFRETGYCHQFKTCKNPAKISRHGAVMYIKSVSFQEQADSNYCQWDPSELNGGYSLGEG